MTAHFRRAIGSEAKPLVGLYAESGCGKTFSALLLASGFVGGDMSRVGMIETESGRGEVYADVPGIGGYSVLPLREDFSPKAYGEGIREAERAGFETLIIDSASHEWEGIGGVLDMAEKNRAGGAKGVLVWQQPKIEHAREFMLRLLQTPIPLVIVCMRARYPMMQITDADVDKWRQAGEHGKPPKVGDWVRSAELAPKQSEDILFEMLVHAWIDREHRAHFTKYSIDSMREVFLDAEPITIETGERLLAWTKRRGEPESREAILGRLRSAAGGGTTALRAAWGQLSEEQRTALKPELAGLKAAAAKAAPARAAGAGAGNRSAEGRDSHAPATPPARPPGAAEAPTKSEVLGYATRAQSADDLDTAEGMLGHLPAEEAEECRAWIATRRADLQKEGRL